MAVALDWSTTKKKLENYRGSESKAMWRAWLIAEKRLTDLVEVSFLLTVEENPIQLWFLDEIAANFPILLKLLPIFFELSLKNVGIWTREAQLRFKVKASIIELGMHSPIQCLFIYKYKVIIKWNVNNMRIFHDYPLILFSIFHFTHYTIRYKSCLI